MKALANLMGNLWSQVVPNKTKCQTLALIFNPGVLCVTLEKAAHFDQSRSQRICNYEPPVANTQGSRGNVYMGPERGDLSGIPRYSL